MCQSKEQNLYTELEKAIGIMERFREDGGFDSIGPSWINSRNSSGLSPLQMAIMLLQQADLDIAQGDKRAIELQDHVSLILQLLLCIGANPRLDILPELNALGFAVSRGVIQACKIISEHDPELINRPIGDDGQFTPFSMAVALLDLSTSNRRQEPIQVRTKENCRTMIEYMVRTMEYNIDTPLPDGGTALEFCVRSDRPEATKFLIELGARLYDEKGANMMHAAVGSEALRSFRVLSKLHPELITDTMKQDGRYITPLDLAIGQSKQAIIEYIASKADWPNTGSQPAAIEALLNAAINGDEKLVQALVNTGADVNKYFGNNTQGTVLQLLCRPTITLPLSLKQTIAKIIISASKFDPTIVDNNSNNMMHHSVALSDIEMCRIIKAKLETMPGIIYRPNKGGVTYLGLAIGRAEGYDIEFIKALVELNPTIINQATEKKNYKEPLKRWIQEVQAIPIADDVPVPTSYNTHAQYPGKWLVSVCQTPFVEALKLGKLDAAEVFSNHPVLEAFEDYAHCTNWHYLVPHAVHDKAHKIAHNLAQKDPNINKVSSFGSTPLAIAAIKWANAKNIGDDREIESARKMLVELCFHGARDESGIAAAQVDGVAPDATPEFLEIVEHADETHHAMHHNMIDALGAEIGGLQL